MTADSSIAYRLVVWITLATFLSAGVAMPVSQDDSVAMIEEHSGSVLQVAPEMRGPCIATHTFVAKPSPTPEGWRDLPCSAEWQRDPWSIPQRGQRAALVRMRGDGAHPIPNLVGMVELRI